MTAATTAFRLSQIGQIAVTVHDVERAVHFYRDTLGLAFLFQVPRMAFFDAGGVRLLLGLPEGSGSAGLSSVLYFRVDDIRGAYDTLRERGVAFEGEPHLIAKLPDHELWMAFFRDSEGNVMAIMSEVR